VTALKPKPAPTRFKSIEEPRVFRLRVSRGKGELFGITLEENYENAGYPFVVPIVTTGPTQTQRVLEAVTAAVRQSGFQMSVINSSQDTSIPLEEVQGVRLALVLLTTQPLTKYTRIRAALAGISAMSIEETYYWYSKCTGIEGSSARKALRTLLADK
jgi:hypothetical protein